MVYIDSFYQIDFSTLWWTVVGVNLLTLCQECRRAADTRLKQHDRVVSGAHFLTVGVFECGIADRRSLAVLCMLYEIGCNPMHPLYGALPVRVTPRPWLHAVRWESQRSVGLLFPNQCLCRTIFLTLYSMV